MNARKIWICGLLVLIALCSPFGMASADNDAGKIQVVASGLDGPYGLFFDGDHLIVTTKGELLKIKNAGEDIAPASRKIEKIASIGEGDALGATLFGSKYIVLNCDANCQGTSRLQAIALDGTVTDIAHMDQGVEVTRWRDSFLVTDIFQNQILEVTSTGQVRVFSNDKLNGPGGMYVDGDNVWVTNFLSGELVVIDAQGRSRVAASGLGAPVGIAFDGLDFIIADYAGGEVNRGRVLRVSKDGDVRVIAKPKSIGNPSALVMQGPDILAEPIGD